MKKIIDILDCRQCKNLVPDFMYMQCSIKKRQVDTKPDENKQAYYPVPTWCPLVDLDYVINQITTAIHDLDSQNDEGEIKYRDYIMLKQNLMWVLKLMDVDIYPLMKG